MTVIQKLLPFGEYLFLIIPSILLVLGIRLFNNDHPRRRILLLLCSALLALALLSLLIFTNPYGRQISSSLPAYGMLPVLIALLVMILSKPQEIARLWSTDRIILLTLILVTPILFVILWLVDHTAFLIVVSLTAILTIAWLVGMRARLALVATLSLIIVGFIVLMGGGAFSTPVPQDQGWLKSGMQAITFIMTVLAIFLSAALLFTGLRQERELNARQLSKHMILVAVLVSGSAYLVFWDGVWSAAHARAFEDHLPFAQFLFSLIAGAMLTLSLPGMRRLTGLLFVFAVTAATTLALIWGWNISAFKLTEQRAARIDQAIARFQLDNRRYPTDLAELTPRYLLYLPPPVIVRQGSWCYQGGEDYYRLGYVSGKFTYFEADFKPETYAQAGSPPPGSWNCDQLVAKYKTGGLNY